MDTLTEDQIVQRVNDWISEQAYTQESFLEREEDALARYLGGRPKANPDSPWEGSSDLDIGGALTLSHVESIHSRTLYALQRSVPFVQVKSKNQDLADQAECYLRHVLDHETGFLRFASRWIRPALVGGCRRAKAVWEKEVQRVGETHRFTLPPGIRGTDLEEPAIRAFLLERLKNRFGEFTIREKSDTHWTIRFDRDGEEVTGDLRYRLVGDRIDATVEWPDVTFEGVRYSAVKPEDFWKSPGTIQECRYVIHRVWMTWPEIVSRAQDGIYDLDLEADYSEFKQYATDPIVQTEGGVDLVEQRRQAAGVSTMILGWEYFEILECYVLDFWDGKDYLEDRLITIFRGPGKILRNELRSSAGYPMRPFSEIIVQPIPDMDSYGLGIPTIIGPLADEETAVHNLMMDSATLQAVPPTFYDETAGLKNEKMKIAPGRLIPLSSPNGNIGNAVYMPNYAANLGPIAGLQNRIDTIMQSVDGVSDTQLAQAPKSKTLGQSTLVQDEINIRFQAIWDNIVGNMEEMSGLAGLIAITAALYQRFGKPMEIEAVTGEYSEVSFPDALKYSLKITANINKINQNAQVAKARGVVQTLMNPMLMQLGLVNPQTLYHALKNLLEAMDVDNWEDFLAEPPQEKMASVNPDKENLEMLPGHIVPVHPADDDQAHIVSHVKFLEELRAEPGLCQNAAVYVEHIKRHRKQEQMKAQQQMQQADMGNGVPGGPAGSPIANTPVPGGAPSMPNGAAGAGAVPNA
jgi:hypothetical protein